MLDDEWTAKNPWDFISKCTWVHRPHCLWERSATYIYIWPLQTQGTPRNYLSWPFVATHNSGTSKASDFLPSREKIKTSKTSCLYKKIYRENWVATKKVGRLAAVSSNFTPKLQPTGTGNLLQFFSHQPGGKFSLPKFVCLFCWLSAPRVFFKM